MKPIWLIAIVAVTAVLQVSFLPALRPMGIVPNLALIVVLYVALDLAASESLALALGIGLLLDIASGVDFGLRTAFLAFIALLVIIIRRTGADFSRPSMLLAALVSAGILWNAAVLAGVVLAHDVIVWGEVFKRLGVEAGINSLILLALHWPLRWLLQIIVGRQPVVAVRG